jgi:glycosyltransferase involved in cell wall biosynthesis
MARICVAIPVKNGAPFLGAAIESVLAQEGVDLEVRVIDNISDDDSVAVAERYGASDPRVSVAVNDEDVKYYGSLNRILAETDAEYFVPFAADDLMYPRNLARKLEAVERTGAGFAHSPAVQIDESGDPTGVVWADHSGTPAVVEAPGFFDRIVPYNAVSCQAVLARTGALREIGGFDARSYYAGDWLAWLRLSLRWPVATIHEPLIANRVHAQTGTATASGAGLNGRDVPATLDLVFSDPRMPAEWQELRDRAVAASHSEAATILHRQRILRLEQGWAAYMAIGRAIARVPGDEQLLAAYRQLISVAGLVPPDTPIEAVAPAPATSTDAAALSETVARFEPLLRRLIVAVEPDDVDAAMEFLDPVFGDTDFDVAVVPTADPIELVVPGRLVIDRWGSEFITAGEARGVPAHPYGIPDPFDRAPERERWDTVDPVGCL